MERDFKGVWIPKEIWLNEELTLLEKCIFVEIDSLDNDNHCTASNEYFAKFCDCSESKITKAINKLQKLNMIEILSFDGRVRTMRVVKNDSQTSKKYEAASQKVLPININNNTNNKFILSKDNINIAETTSADEFSFGISKTRKLSLYEKCINIINEFTNIPKLRDLLVQYLNVCLEMKSLKGANQWKGMVNNTLVKVQQECAPHTYEEIVQVAIDHSWKTFYPIKDFSGTSFNNSFSNAKKLEGFVSPDIRNDGLNHIKVEREF